MGNYQPKTRKEIVYSVEVSEAKQGETPIYRNPLSVQELVSTPKTGAKNLQKVILDSIQKYGKNNFLGTRRGPKREFEFKTYEEIFEASKKIGSAIINLNLVPEIKNYEGIDFKFVGIHAPNSEEWVILDIANMLYGNTMIPLYVHFAPDTVEYVLNHSEITTLFCSSSTIQSTLNSKNIPNLKNIIMIDEFSQEIQKEVIQKGFKLFKWEDLLKAGEQKIQEFPEIPKNCSFTFSYTSGTTGDPKCVIVQHSHFMVFLASFEHLKPAVTESDTHISYRPLPHLVERMFLAGFLHSGGSIYFFGGDITKLREDLVDIKPTIFGSVPRLYNKFYTGIKSKFEQATGLQKLLIDKAVSDKLYYLEHEGAVTHKLWDSLVFNKTKALLGGRCNMLLSGAAPISKDVINFLKITMCCGLKEGYGLTESCGDGLSTVMEDITYGHVGGPNITIEVKLIDVPQMNYTSLDRDQEGRPQPRGEICLRGPSIFSGYYKDKKLTEEVKDKDGWLHTGDIGVRLPSGAFKIIDRISNIFKLSDGKYIAPEIVENIYCKTTVVEQVFLYGEPLQNFCIGIIHPNEQAFNELAKSKNQTGTFEELCKNQVMEESLLDIITEQGKIDKLIGFEQAQRVALVPKNFQEFGCLTTTLKLQRKKAKISFQEDIDRIYRKSQ